MVERPAERPAQLARMLAVVADPRHHVAAAELLRILESGRRERLAGPEVDELQDDRRGPDIEGDAEQPLPRWPQVVQRASVLREQANAPIDHPHRRVHLERRAARRHEDAQPAAEDGELDVLVVALHDRAAGEPVARPQECLLGVRGGEGPAPGGHLDDALVAAPGPAARGRHDELQLVGRVEERPPGDERHAMPPVDEIGRHRRSISGANSAAERRSARGGRESARSTGRSAAAPLDVPLRQTILTVHGSEPTRS